MAFPTTAIETANLSAGTADPSLARVDLLEAVENINTIIAEKNTADGVLVLNENAQVQATMLPNTFAPTGQLTLAPSTGVVKVEDILRLQQIPSAVLAITEGTAGDVAVASDADSGAPALAFYDGTEWKFLPSSVLESLP
jgi:hypothetical protein